MPYGDRGWNIEDSSCGGGVEPNISEEEAW